MRPSLDSGAPGYGRHLVWIVLVGMLVASLAAAPPAGAQLRDGRFLCVETPAGGGGRYTIDDLTVSRNGRCKVGARRVRVGRFLGWLGTSQARLRGPAGPAGPGGPPRAPGGEGGPRPPGAPRPT